MFRQESGRLGADQNEGPDAGSSQGDSNSDGQTQAQGGFVDAAKDKIQQLASQARETASRVALLQWENQGDANARQCRADSQILGAAAP